MIECKICNKKFKILNGHLRLHNISCKEYKLIFSSELTSEETKEKGSITRSTRDYSNLKPLYDRTDESIKSRQYSQERNRKISESKKKYWESRKGKTVEELFGEEKGRQIRKIKSEQTKGANNPAYNKVYKNTGRVKGYYKKIFFRSLWELSYMKYLEQNNIDLEEVEYEPIAIKYFMNGSERTYRPDFFLTKQRKLVEIKSNWHLKNNIEMITLKKQAAEKWCADNCATYELLTEDDFPIIPLRQFKQDKDVTII